MLRDQSEQGGYLLVLPVSHQWGGQWAMDNVHWTWPTKLVAADVGVDRRGIICLFVKAIFNAQGSIKARGIPVGVTCVSPMGWAMGMDNVHWTWPTKLVAAQQTWALAQY